MSSDTTKNWLRPVIGLVEQPASATSASGASQCMCLKKRFIEYRILRPAARRSCNQMFGLDYVSSQASPHALPSPTPEARQRAGVRASAGVDPRVGGREVLHGGRQAARRPGPPGEARPVGPRQIERKCLALEA